MKNIVRHFGVYLLFAFCFMTLSDPSFSAEKNKSEKIHVSGKTLLDGKPFPGAELYLQTIDWIDGRDEGKLKRIGKSRKDGSFSYDFKKKQNQNYHIVAFKPGKALGWVMIIEKTINESADIPMSQLNSTFSGIVTDENGKPIPDVNVKIKGISVESLPFENQSLRIFNSMPGTFTKTDKNGKFSYDRLPPNANLALELEADGYCYPHTVSEELKTSAENVEFTLFPEGVIEGRVTYSDTGKPVADVTVICSSQIGKTDKNGFYRIPKLSEGNYTVTLSLDKPKYDGWVAEQKENIGVEFGKTQKVDLEILKGILITGKVTDKSSGKPAEGVNVSIRSKRGLISTDKNGTYKLWSLPGEIEITAFGNQNSEYSSINKIGENVKSITIFPNDTIKTVDLIVGSKVKITGKVSYPDGRPAKKVIMYFFAPRPVYTDKNGVFTDKLEGEAIGKKIHYIADIPGEELEGSTEIEAIEGNYGEIILHPYNYIKLRGKTVDKSSNPVPGVKISLIRAAGMSSIERDSTAVSDQNGDFTVEKLRKERSYFISAYDTQICSPLIDTRKPIQPEPYILVIPDSTHSVWGKITDENGAPVPDVELFINFSHGHKQTLSDSLGYYRFDGIINNIYGISTKSRKFGRDSFRNLGIDSENNLVLRDKNRWLNGYVYDKDGKPIPGIYVSTNLTPHYSWLDYVKTDTNGKFRLRNLKTDTVDLQIYEDKYSPNKIIKTQLADKADTLKTPEPFRQEFKGIKTNQEIILKTEK